MGHDQWGRLESHKYYFGSRKLPRSCSSAELKHWKAGAEDRGDERRWNLSKERTGFQLFEEIFSTVDSKILYQKETRKYRETADENMESTLWNDVALTYYSVSTSQRLLDRQLEDYYLFELSRSISRSISYRRLFLLFRVSGPLSKLLSIKDKAPATSYPLLQVSLGSLLFHDCSKYTCLCAP